MRFWRYGYFLAVAFFLVGVARVLAVNDAPPELEHPNVPGELPPIGQPSPHIRGTLKIQFAGNTSFNDRQLREGIARQIETIEEYGLDAPNAYDAEFFLEAFYRKNGYSQAAVESRILGPWLLRLSVQEGPRTLLGTVTIEGGKGIDAETLRKYLLGPTQERFPRIRREILLPFVESDISSGADLVSRLYASEGYLDAVVEPPVITFNDAKTMANVDLKITEGVQSIFSRINFEGDLIFPRDTLVALINEETRRIYTDGRLAAAERKLEDYYKQRGYFTAEVTGTSDVASAVGGKVTATFTIRAGPLYRFDGSTVAGNKGVKTSFIQKRLQPLQGQVYSPEAIDKRFRVLLETGLFKNLRITPSAISDNLVHLDVNVEETRPKEFGIGLGYASFYGGILDLSFSNRNLFGTGRPLTVETEINQRGFGGEIKYTDPWLFDSDYKFSLRLYALSSTLKGYSKGEIGVQPTLSRKLTDHLELSAYAQAKYVALRDVLIEPFDLVGPSNYSVVSFGLLQTLDYRNNPTLPTKGFVFSTGVDFAPGGLGAVSFIRGTARFSYYIPVTTNTNLAIGLRAGVIGTLGSGELPIDERFFNGGATTVRSFSELTLGPKDSQGWPLGGEGMTVFNIEYTFPLIGDLKGAVFCDAGNVVQSASSFGLENMRYAIGAGLRYNLPIGALRLDYGLNPDPQDGEAQGAFHFAIGVAF